MRFRMVVVPLAMSAVLAGCGGGETDSGDQATFNDADVAFA